MYFDVFFDGLVGSTHNYGGLSEGNLPSMAHKGWSSSPKNGALQGLQKMRLLTQLGFKQGVLPPQIRPTLETIEKLGFTLDSVPFELLIACSSSSFMWAANLATVSPSCDTLDKKVHFTAANLHHTFHRSLELPANTSNLKKIFSDTTFFTHHPPLPSHPKFSDEGNANHIRLDPNIHLLVYGGSSQKFPNRQKKEASLALARTHQIDALVVEQHPEAIESGVFHNDVISFGNRNVWITHEKSFVNQQEVEQAVLKRNAKLQLYHIEEKELSLQEAVSTYFFNSQLITTETGKYQLILPLECQTHPKVQKIVTRLLEEVLDRVYYIDLLQSMQNGGGPACLRLPMLLNREEIEAIDPRFWLDDILYQQLQTWIEQHYRDTLTIRDLRDPLLHQEAITALEALQKILPLA